MIVRMTGILAEVHRDHVVIDRDGVGYEVLVCGYAMEELGGSIGQKVTLHTMEYYEAGSVGGNLVPRLVGFLHPEDRAFFNRFITVKSIGVRKAIKALVKPMPTIAAAIESGDAGALTRLPGIGKRAADQIIAELKGKVTDFAVGAVQITGPAEAGIRGWTDEQHDALEVIVALGERRVDAERWLQRAIQLYPNTQKPDEWVRLAYRVRSGSES